MFAPIRPSPTMPSCISPPRRRPVVAGGVRFAVYGEGAGTCTSGPHDYKMPQEVRVTMTRTVAVPAPEASGSADDLTRVAVSTVIFSLRRRPADDAPVLVLPLVRRTRDPYEGLWALPGGWLDHRESLDAAARRTLAETTALAPSYLE